MRFAAALAASSGALVAAVRRWLDLDAAPQAIDAALAAIPGAPGVRLPGSVDAFELAVRAVLGQQVTVARGACHGRARRRAFRRPRWRRPGPDIDRVFPAPAALAAEPVERIAELGIIRQRAGAIVALAREWPEIAPLLQPRAAPEALIERLCRLPGIGPWTAHYIAMRVLGWPDALPPNDVAVLKAMRRLFGSATPRAAERQAQRWQPWRAYAVMRLWNNLESTS